MNNRKLDVSRNAATASVASKRMKFDGHLNSCDDCHDHTICLIAQSLWRDVCIEALRNRAGA